MEARPIDKQETVWRRLYRIRGWRLAAGQRAEAFAHVGLKRGDVDQAHDVRVVARPGDDDAAIAVSDENRRPVLLVQHAIGSGDIVLERGFGKLGNADLVAIGLQD